MIPSITTAARVGNLLHASEPNTVQQCVGMVSRAVSSKVFGSGSLS